MALAKLETAKARYLEFLKCHKMLLTKERVSLIEFIFSQSRHFSADELLFEIQRTGLKVSRATLYRTLSQLVDAGILSESDFGHNHTHYEIDLGSKPHVHLIGMDEGEVKEVSSPQLEFALQELVRREGFTVKRYKIQVFGKFERRQKESK